LPDALRVAVKVGEPCIVVDVKVGKEIRALADINANIISSVSGAARRLRARRYGFFKAVFLGAVLLNIMLLPINVSFSSIASAETAFDPDPVHAQQMEALQKAVQSGADQDPVHAAQVAAYYAAQGAQADEPQAHAVQVSRQPHVSDEASNEPSEDARPEPARTNASEFWVNPNSSAKAQAQAWRDSRQSDAAKMDYLAAQPTAVWLGNWNSDVGGDVSRVVQAADKAGQVPVFVAYNIPNRDCGGYSAGGSATKDAYTSWVGAIARGIGSQEATVILEPDALAGLSCLSGADQEARTDLLASAVSILKSGGKTRVYLDAGHAGWVDAGAMASRLQKAGIQKADGFALNVSNFDATSVEEQYGQAISSLLGGAHFVVDTSRNGNGSNGQWCNPEGRATGQAPTTDTHNKLIDAYLWLKTPGESDGACNGGPAAGVWWPDYALGLVK
jgi:endoglucanase